MGLAAIVYGLIWLAKTSPAANNNVASGAAQIPAVSAGDWQEGSTTSSVTLVEYGDFECPVCSVYAPVLDQLMKDFGNKILFAWRQFPLESIHPNAALAAAASEAAGAQGKFWEMHDLLFQNQNAWVTQSTADAEKTFAGYATKLGLDAQKFQSDMSSPSVTGKIQSDYADDLKMGLTYTPSFFLGGKLIQNPQNYDEFKQLIEQSLAAH